ncbi:MAG: glycosyltransferase [Halioglobus sp.]|nr:glycosyltransferase [Halioglobus sp.]
MSRPVVSVLMLAWEHGRFIHQAIESVLAQQSPYSFELLIGEDASSDNTRAVCEQFQARFPDTVKVLAAADNLGMHGNFARLWERACGEYIAFCEGDDYWCDDTKLARQVEFLRSNTDCTLCGTFTEKITEDDTGRWVSAGSVMPATVKHKYGFEELVAGYHFHFSSVMLRKDSVHFPTWFSSVYCVDRPLYLLAAVNGQAGLLPEVMSVYRLHEGGNWSAIAIAHKARRSTDLFLTLRDHFDRRYRDLFERTLAAILWSYMSEELHRGQRRAARKIFWQSLRLSPATVCGANPALFFKVLVLLYAPGHTRLLRGQPHA